MEDLTLKLRGAMIDAGFRRAKETIEKLEKSKTIESVICEIRHYNAVGGNRTDTVEVYKEDYVPPIGSVDLNIEERQSGAIFLNELLTTYLSTMSIVYKEVDSKSYSTIIDQAMAIVDSSGYKVPLIHEVAFIDPKNFNRFLSSIEVPYRLIETVNHNFKIDRLYETCGKYACIWNMLKWYCDKRVLITSGSDVADEFLSLAEDLITKDIGNVVFDVPNEDQDYRRRFINCVLMENIIPYAILDEYDQLKVEYLLGNSNAHIKTKVQEELEWMKTKEVADK